MTSATAAGNRVLYLGLDPAALHPDDLGPGHKVDPAAIRAGIDHTLEELKGLRYDATFINLRYEDAESVLQQHLQAAGNTYDVVLIGGGIRMIPKATLLFEKIINLLREAAPRAKVCFNQTPASSVEAVQRWLPSAELPADAKGSAHNVYN